MPLMFRRENMTAINYSKKYQDKFARVNEEYEKGLKGLTPCAKLLHRWLVRLAKPFTLFEINLIDFQKSSQNYRADNKGGFCFSWIKKAFRELVEQCLVFVEHKYNKKEFKIRVRRPNDSFFSSPVEINIPFQSENPTTTTDSNSTPLNDYSETPNEVHKKNENFSSQNQNINSENQNKTSQKMPSNNENSSPSSRYNQRTTDTPPSNRPVVVPQDSSCNSKTEIDNQQEKEESQTSKEAQNDNSVDHKNTNKTSAKVKLDSIPHDFLLECKTANIRIHPKLIEKMCCFTMGILKNALAVVKEQISSGREVRNPTGMFVVAMENEWKPNVIKRNPEMMYGIEFQQWYKKAVHAGLVEDLPVRHLSAIRNIPLVRIPKPQGSIPPYQLMLWTEARDKFGHFD